MVKLSQDEVTRVNGNEDAIAQLLIKKAILEEIAKKDYTEEEKRVIEDVKTNAEIEFYLNSIAQNNITMYDYELLELYKENIAAFKDRSVEEATAQLKQVLFNKKLGEEKAKIINSLIEKYELNDIIKTYIKKEDEKAVEKVE